MSGSEFAMLYAVLCATMLASRCMPLFLLRTRRLSERVERALNLIPVAAFAALVANDLLEPAQFIEAPFDGLMTIIASGIVVLVARKTESLIWSSVAGLAAYGLLVLAL